MYVYSLSIYQIYTHFSKWFILNGHCRFNNVCLEKNNKNGFW